LLDYGRESLLLRLLNNFLRFINSLRFEGLVGDALDVVQSDVFRIKILAHGLTTDKL